MELALSIEDRIIKARITINEKKPFFACLLSRCTIEEDTIGITQSIGINAEGRMYYNKKWLESLTQGQLVGVIQHEVFHLALLHLTRLGQRNMGKWNIANDAVVNVILVQEGTELPDGVLPDRYGTLVWGNQTIVDCHKKCSEEIYDELEDEDEDEDGDGNNDSKKGFDTHVYKKVGKDGKLEDLTKEEQRKLEREWKKAFAEAATYAKQRGMLPGGIERMLERVLAPVVNWRALLHKFMVSNLPADCTWNKPNKKGIAFGTYLPSVVRENIEVCILVDMSGSTFKDYTRFMSEMIGMSKVFGQMKMRCIFWDTSVLDDVEASNGNIEKILLKKPFKGGGGTTFGCVVDYMKKHNINPKVCVVFTDGYVEGSPPKPNCEHLLWVLTFNGISDFIKKCGGTIIKMDNNDKKREDD